MRSASLSRWAVSFADLTLLLLGLFLMLYVAAARDGTGFGQAQAAPGSSVAGVILSAPAAELFEPGEARLTARARARLNEVGRQAGAHRRRLRVEMAGAAEGGRRFDRWELGAARAAAAARALEEGGSAQQRIEILVPPVAGRSAPQPQRIIVRGG